jgi:hypothetical protein
MGQGATNAVILSLRGAPTKVRERRNGLERRRELYSYAHGLIVSGHGHHQRWDPMARRPATGSGDQQTLVSFFAL